MNSPLHLRADPHLLREAFRALKAEKKLRTRDAAAALGVTEGEAIASGVGSGEGFSPIRLHGDYAALIASLDPVGEVMALTSLIEVTADRVYFQCAKALVRSRLWAAKAQVPRASVPSNGQILAEISAGRVDAVEYDRAYPERIRSRLY